MLILLHHKCGNVETPLYTFLETARTLLSQKVETDCVICLLILFLLLCLFPLLKLLFLLIMYFYDKNPFFKSIVFLYFVKMNILLKKDKYNKSALKPPSIKNVYRINLK
jgi:hypothetical protein